MGLFDTLIDRAKRLRREIETDPDLDPERKRTLLARLDEKTGDAAPYDGPGIARRNKPLYEKVFPATVARVQNARLAEHDKTITLATKTMQSLAKARKAYARLETIGVRIHADRQMAFGAFQAKLGELEAAAAGHERTKRRTLNEIELDRLRADVERERLEGERDKLRDARTRPPPETPESRHEQRMRRLEEDFEFQKRQVEFGLALKALGEEGASETSSLAAYKAARAAVESSGLTGEALAEALRAVDAGFGFDRDGEDGG